MNDEQAREFAAYIAHCDECAIVPDTAGAFLWAWQATRSTPVVSVETLEAWKRRVNTLATCGLKADRYRIGAELKQVMVDAIAAQER